MQIVKAGDDYVATLTPVDVEVLDRVLDPLLPYAKHDRLGQYRRMTPEEFWMKLVGQICVMGSARHWERAMASLEVKALLHYDVVRAKRDAASYLAAVLKDYSVTRFHPSAAVKLANALTNARFFSQGKLVAFNDLPVKQGSDAIRIELRNRWDEFGMKSASDFMITVGLSTDVVALDSRIVGFLNRYCQFTPKAGQLQSSPDRYRAVEQALREYATNKGISLAKLDRTLFQFTSRTVVDFIAGTPGLQMTLTSV